MWKNRLIVLKEARLEDICLLIIFTLTWLGFGVYNSGFLAILFLFSFFFKAKRKFLLQVVKDRAFIILLGLFVLNNIISSLFSIDRYVSTSLSVLWFFLIFIPIAYVRFSLHRENDFFIKAIVPVGFFISLIVLVYLSGLFIHSIATIKRMLRDYTFYFMSEGSTPDMIIILGGIGYGLIRQRAQKGVHWYGFFYLLFCVFGIILTGDRGGGIALIVLVLILLSTDYKRLIIFLIIIAIVFFITYKVKPILELRRFYEYISEKSVRDYIINVGQIYTFKVAWLMIKDHWLLGVGTNNFWTFSDLYGREKFAYAHNIVLQFWAENGLFGMIFGLSIIGLIIYRWVKSFKLYKYRYIAFGMGASFIAMLVAQLTNCTIWAFQSAVPFWLLVGAINAVFYIVKDRGEESLQRE